MGREEAGKLKHREKNAKTLDKHQAGLTNKNLLLATVDRERCMLPSALEV